MRVASHHRGLCLGEAVPISGRLRSFMIFDNSLSPLDNRPCGARVANKRLADRPNRHLSLSPLFRLTSHTATSPGLSTCGTGSLSDPAGSMPVTPLNRGIGGIDPEGDTPRGGDPRCRQAEGMPHFCQKKAKVGRHDHGDGGDQCGRAARLRATGGPRSTLS